MLEAYRTVLLALIDTHPAPSKLQDTLKNYAIAIQHASEEKPHDTLLFKTENYLEGFISLLEHKTKK